MNFRQFTSILCIFMLVLSSVTSVTASSSSSSSSSDQKNMGQKSSKQQQADAISGISSQEISSDIQLQLSSQSQSSKNDKQNTDRQNTKEGGKQGKEQNFGSILLSLLLPKKKESSKETIITTLSNSWNNQNNQGGNQGNNNNQGSNKDDKGNANLGNLQDIVLTGQGIPPKQPGKIGLPGASSDSPSPPSKNDKANDKVKDKTIPTILISTQTIPLPSTIPGVPPKDVPLDSLTYQDLLTLYQQQQDAGNADENNARDADANNAEDDNRQNDNGRNGQDQQRQQDTNNGNGVDVSAGLGSLGQGLGQGKQSVTHGDDAMDAAYDDLSPEEAIDVRVPEPVLAGVPFTIQVTARHEDQNIDKVALGTPPFSRDRFTVASCPEPLATECEAAFELYEEELGPHTYRVVYHTVDDRTTSRDVVVTVTDQPSVSSFLFRTAAVDSEALHTSNRYEYLPETNIVVRDEYGDVAAQTANSTFSTFFIPSNNIFLIDYQTPGYQGDTDVVFFDGRLASCSDNECSFTSNQNGVSRTTACEYSADKRAYLCEVTGGPEGSFEFSYKPRGDSLGDHVIRYYNPLVQSAAPSISTFDPVTITGDEEIQLDLDTYVSDADTPIENLQWTYDRYDHVSIRFDLENDTAFISSRDPTFSGNDQIRFTVSDGEHADSEVLSITLVSNQETSPVISEYSPLNVILTMKEREQQQFYVEVDDADGDDILYDWYLGGADGSRNALVASETMSYLYDAPNAVPNGVTEQRLTFHTDDGDHVVTQSWLITVEDVPPEADFSVMRYPFIISNPPIRSVLDDTISAISGEPEYHGRGTVREPAFFVAGRTPAHFVDQTIPGTDTIKSYLWDFGFDAAGVPATSTARNPTVRFPTGGVFNVSLTVTDRGGSTDTVTKEVTIVEAPSLTITSPVEGSVVSEGMPVTFSADISDLEDDLAELDIEWRSDVDGVIGSGSTFTASMLSPGVHTITLTVTDTQGIVSTATVHIRVNGLPSISILFPINDMVFNEGTSIDMAVFSGDDEDNTLQFELSSAVDGVLATDDALETTEAVHFDVSSLSPGPHVITATVTDSDGGTFSDTVTIRINALPTISITSPLAGQVITQGDEVTLSAAVADRENPAPDLHVEWVSDVDGSLGVVYGFDDLTTTMLSPGQHVITATVTDKDDASASATVTFRINVRPQVLITAPEEGQVLTEGVPSLFTAIASDTEDDASELTFEWSSDVSGVGVFGSGVSLMASLPAGNYSVGVRVTDLDGATATALVNIRVNAAPAVTITSPADGSVVNVADGVLFTADVADVEDDSVGTPLSIVWVSDLEADPIGTGESFAIDTLVTGTHVITVTVTDGDGASSQATTTFRVNAYPTISIDSPIDGQVVNEGADVLLNAFVADAEDAVADLLVVWVDTTTSTSYTNANNFTVSDLSVGEHQFTVTVTDSDGASSSAPFTIVVNALPTITITSPAEGAVVHVGSDVILSADVADAEDDLAGTPLSVEWESDVDGPLGSGASLNTSTLSTGVHMLTVTITDSNGATASATVTIRVNALPVVDIMSPSDGGNYTVGEAVHFAARINDAEDDAAGTPLSIGWVSDLEADPIGREESFTIDTLVAGTHVITLTATDSDGAAVTASIQIEIIPTLNTRPTARIIDPLPGQYAQGAVVSFTAEVSDLEDDDERLSVEWISDIDYSIGEGLSFNRSDLSPGVHTITLEVEDSGGLQATDTVQIEITETPVDNPPYAEILSPLGGELFLEGELVTLKGDARDIEDGIAGTPVTIEWSSDRDGALGTTEDIDDVLLSVGTHVITLRVVDSNTSETTATVIIDVLPNTAPVVAITAPLDGAVYNVGEAVPLAVTLTDAEEDPSELFVVWESDRDGELFSGAYGSGVFGPRTALSVGTHQITFTARDRGNLEDSETVTVTIRINTAPQATLVRPADGNQYAEGASVSFEALVTDDYDLVDDLSISWVSDVDGEFGTSASFSTSTLSVGVHHVTLTVTDSDGASASPIQFETEITALPPRDNPPYALITVPSSDSRFNQGDDVSFAAIVGDDKDDAAGVPLTIMWESSIDDVLPETTSSFTKNDLSEGTHTITLTVTDSAGQSTSVTVTITIVVPVNNLPVVGITSPVDDSSYEEGSEVVFSATATDVEDNLAGTPLSIEWESDLEAEPLGDTLSFTRNDLVVGTHTITLTVTDSAGQSGQASIQLTIVLPTNDAPVADIISPVNNTTFMTGDEVLFSATVSDVEDDAAGTPLTIDWRSNRAAGSLGTTASFSRSDLALGHHIITLTVTDSEGVSTTDTVELDVLVPGNDPPAAVVNSPVNALIVNVGDPVVFDATVSDTEDDLAGTPLTLLWESDLQGELGTTASFTRNDLLPGTHRITLTVTDSAGSPTTTLPRTVTVNALPTVTITSPAVGAVVHAGSDVTLSADVADAEDDLAGTPLSVEWESDVDGPLGSGASLSTSTLSAGDHALTVTITDSNGATASATVNIRVNALPTLLVSSPVDGSSHEEGTDVSFAATIIDAEDDTVGTPLSIEWESDLAGTTIGVASTFTRNDLVVGTHTVTVTVTDSDGGQQTRTFTLTITEGPPPNTAPRITLNSPAADAVVENTDSFTADVTVTDDNSPTLSCTFTVDSVVQEMNSAVSNGIRTTFTATGLDYGQHSWNVQCGDGELSTSAETRTVTVADTIPPSIAITSPIADAVIPSTTVQLRFGVTDTGVGLNTSACMFALDTADTASLVSVSCTGQDILGLSEGSHMIVVHASDNSGNSNNATVAFTVDTTGTIIGTVTDSGDGSPVVGASVRLKRGTAVIAAVLTDTAGSYSINALAGDYTLTIVATDYDQVSIPVTITAASTVTYDVGLVPFVTPVASLSGVVRDNRNELYGVLVELLQNNRVVASARTDANGLYSFSGLQTGVSYDVSFSKPGFTLQTLSVAVPETGGSLSRDATLLQNNAVGGGVAGVIYSLSDFSTITGATITIYKSGTTEIVQVIESDDEGEYLVNGLPSMFTYDLEAAASGFTTQTFATGAGVASGEISADNDAFMS